MSLGYDILAELPNLRRQAESRMTETVVAESVTITSDPDTGEPVRTVTATWYTGIARYRSTSMVVSDPVAGGAQFAVAQPVLSTPFGSARVPVGAEFRITGSIDPLLVGVTLLVKGSPQSGQVTAHRYPVTEQQ